MIRFGYSHFGNALSHEKRRQDAGATNLFYDEDLPGDGVHFAGG
jgi:hypothetical protein